MVKRQVVSGQRERNKERFKDETNCSRKLGKVTFQNHCDSKISKSLWNSSGFNKNLSAKFKPNYTRKVECDRIRSATLGTTADRSHHSRPAAAEQMEAAGAVWSLG